MSSPLSPEDAILTLAVMAAFTDGTKDDRERDHLREVAESLGQADPNLPRIYHAVLLKRVGMTEAVAALPLREQRQLAYEMAVCVCDADGVQCQAERAFLAELKQALGLDGDAAALAVETQADAIAAAAAQPLAGPATAAAQPAHSKPEVPDTTSEAERTAALDKTILNYAVVNGALELLPQSWASVAIIPLQIKMVYRIGKAYGYELDQSHIRELLATVGVGLTSQYVEQIGRRLLGGLLGKVGGKALRGVGAAATGVAFSFATTYALGHVARRYYAGGRQMSTQLLKDAYQQQLGPARDLQQQYLPAIRERARTLDAGSVMALVRGQQPLG